MWHRADFYQAVFFIFITPLLLLACSDDQHHHPHLKTGKQLYEFHCAACHGVKGTGRFLKAVPANITTNKTKYEIMLHIKQSDSSKRKMPVFKSMPDKEAQLIAQYLLVLKDNYFNNPENRDKFLLQRQN